MDTSAGSGRKTAAAPWAPLLADPTARADLGRALAPLLTAEVTRRLPAELAFDPQDGDIDAWIARADGIARIHTITRTDTGALAGLLLLSSADDCDGRDLMIGYFLGRAHWGAGLASDMLAGLVERLDRGPRRRLLAGTDGDNLASQRVLEKAGFERDRSPGRQDRVTFGRACGS
ncbi:MAG: GNAT family N-acetyltransferase [Anaerolineales bacterium]|nr:GNAT family N-acetyltransferase [Anaerolineales bacterium]MCB1358051.1 GNAT family N-acetyltransferase [Maritimibacter sp.]